MSHIGIFILRKHLDPRVAFLDQNAKPASQSGIRMPSASPSRIEMPPWHFDPTHSDPDATWVEIYANLCWEEKTIKKKKKHMWFNLL